MPQNSNEIRLIRLYDNSSTQQVWDAFADPAQAAHWWGPRGFSITTHSKDLRPGGSWNYIMHGPDGVDYPNHTVYHEVVDRQKLVYDHGAGPDKQPLFRVTLLLKETPQGTLMDMTMTLPTPQAADNIRQLIKKASGNSTWDRLGEYLIKTQTGKEVFIINHSFPASINTLFNAWTNPKILIQWAPPTGSTMEFFKADIKPAGHSFYSMTHDKTTLYAKTHYHQIQPPTLLSYTQQFVDQHQQPSRHPLAPTFPSSLKTLVQFAQEEPLQTRVTVNWEPHEDSSPSDVETFISARTGMTAGWTGSFTKLESIL